MPQLRKCGAVAALTFGATWVLKGSSQGFLLVAAPPAGHAGAAAVTAALEPLASAPRQPESGSASSTGATAAAVAVVAALSLSAARAASGRRNQSRTQRRATFGTFWRDHPKHHANYAQPWPYPSKRNFWSGEQGYSTKTRTKREDPNPARQSLKRVTEALLKFVPSEFYLEDFAKLKAEDVRAVGSCMTDSGCADIVVPAKVPQYVKPGIGLRLEKEKGQKRPPLETDAYASYVDKRSTVETTASETAKKSSFSTEKDVVCDRESLLLLLDYLSETLSPELKMMGQSQNAVDSIKIVKGAGGRSMVLECIFERKNLWAEFRPYRGGWKRSEVSNKGNFMPAWERLATGDHSASMMITGLTQIAGTRAGKTPKSYRFVEFQLGGLSFLSRARTHAESGGKSVELKHKNWYYQHKVTVLKTYYQMLLGGVDIMSMALQRSGKIVQVIETTMDSLLKKQPVVAEAADRRMGRLASLLKKVKGAIDSSSEQGPWVLQWQSGELVLGKYEKPEEEEEVVEESEEASEDELVDATAMA